MPASRAIAMSKVESPTMTLSRRFRTGLGERLLEHRRMRFRGMIVGGLDGREDAGPAMAVEEMRDPAPRFPGRDAELDLVPRRELGEKLGRALEQRLAVGRVGAQALEGGLVAASTRNAWRSDSPTIRASARGSAARGRAPGR